MGKWAHTSRLNKVLSIVLMVAILGAIGTLAYIITSPKVGERFTEFYILGLEGKAEGYPKELKVEEEGAVIVGIVNRERETVTYRLEVTIDGLRHNEVGPIVLGHGERWEREVGFTPVKVGEKQKVEFMLYKSGQNEPYRTLDLRIDVEDVTGPIR